MKKISVLLLSLILLLTLVLSAQAVEVPDLSRTGSITFLMDWEGSPLTSGSLQMYQVGEIVENNGDYSFDLIADLADAGLTLDDLDSPELAEALEAMVREKDLPQLSAPVQAGKAVFSDLSLGLYLVTQDADSACEEFAPISPFLITVPRVEEEGYVYAVTAEPKISLETEPTEPSEPSEPTEPSEPSEPTEPSIPDEPGLPQTGQLNWPVPILAASGLLLFLLGWFLRYGKRESYEK